MGEPALTLRGVTKNFAGVRAVDGVDMRLDRGRITGVIGPNGAGKSTVINLVSGLIRPSAGEIRFGDTDLNRLSMAQRARLGIRRSFQHPHLLEGATARTMLALAASSPSAAGMRAYDLDEVAERFGFGDRIDAVVDDLPYGHQKLLNLAMLWLGRSHVALIDEPYAGVGPEHVDAVTRVIRTMAESGTAIMLVEHNLEIVAALSHGVVVLDLGKVIFAGTMDVALRDRRVMDAYLGADAGGQDAEAAA
jgi:branched-chain amino acid transport system ATP-binding protein